MNQSTPTLSSEIRAYNVVRRRLIELAKSHPGLLDVQIARNDRMCRSCKCGPVSEYDDDAFLCSKCGHTWTIPHPGSVF